MIASHQATISEIGIILDTMGPSDRCLSVLRNQDLNHAEREQAFEDLLALREGWWGSGRLVTFVMAVALREARLRLGRGNEDRLDWEGIADEALVLLFNRAHTIESAPKNWLWGVVKRLTAQEVRKSWPELVASEVSESQPARESVDPDMDADEEKRQQQRHERISAAVRQLPPTLREVAQLTFLESCDREEVCERLGITPATARKRFQRLRQSLVALSALNHGAWSAEGSRCVHA
jgi:RNA polymerase sigma factor (sigma-70 family)